jgi:hypothetical protein
MCGLFILVGFFFPPTQTFTLVFSLAHVIMNMHKSSARLLHIIMNMMCMSQVARLVASALSEEEHVCLSFYLSTRMDEDGWNNRH